MAGAPQTTPPTVETTKTRARQGAPAQGMIWVLIVSVVFGCIVVAAAWVWHAGGFNRGTDKETPSHAQAGSFHTPPPPSPSGPAATSPAPTQ